MWYELFVITASGLGVAIFLIYLLAARIPTQEDLVAVGMAVVDAKLKEFNLTSSGAGGRKPEGMLERILEIPGVQSYIGNMLKNMGTGGVGGYLGP